MSKTVTILMAVQDQLAAEIQKLDLGHRVTFNAPVDYAEFWSRFRDLPERITKYREMREHHKALNPFSFREEHDKVNLVSRAETGYSINIVAEGLYALQYRIGQYIKAES